MAAGIFNLVLEYLDLLSTKYGLPPEAISLTCLKNIAREPGWDNPCQRWLEVEPQELNEVRYDTLWGGARSIAVIELTKSAQPFTLDLVHPPTPLVYESSKLLKSLLFVAGLLKKGF